MIKKSTRALLCAGLLVACGPAETWAAPAAPSISEAPTITYGELNTSGGQNTEFFKLASFAGDRVTVRLETALPAGDDGYPTFDVYSPGVDDFSLSSSEPVIEKESQFPGTPKQQFVLAMPFSGLAPVRIYPFRCAGCRTAVGYTFTATVEHATSMNLGALPKRVLHSRTLNVTATVQSPAGAPSGACLFERIVGSKKQRVASSPLRSGKCASLIRAPKRGRFQVRASFISATGDYRDATKTSHTIRTR